MRRPALAAGFALSCVLSLLSACGSSSGSSGSSVPRDPFLSASTQLTTSGPIQVLFLGDSISFSLGFGLANGQTAYNLHILDDAQIGCGVVSGEPIRFQGKLDSYDPSTASVPQDQPPDCPNWASMWSEDVAKVKPDVVAIVLGRWETVDRMHNGKWMNVGMPAYDSYVASNLEKAMHIAASRGARLLVMTMPYMKPLFAPDGSQYPETLKSRADQFNAILWKVVDKYPGWITVFDLNSYVDPNCVYTDTVNGVQVRRPADQYGNPDWDHFSISGAEFVAPKVDPLLAALGKAARTGTAPVRIHSATSLGCPAPSQK